MKRLFTALAAWLAAAPVYAADWAVADMNRQIDQTNFVVNRGCSGTLIDVRERLVLTANHCVTDQYETIEREKVADDGTVTKEKVRRLRDGTVSQLSFRGAESVITVQYRTKLKAVDRDRDLAVMQIIADIPNTTASALACETPVRGEKAYIVGNPMGSLYSSVTTGIISSVQREYATLEFGDSEQAKQPLMQVSGGIIGGNSGGAVYNVAGKLIGVPVLGHRTNEVIGFAVPLAEIKTFLRDNKITLADCAK